MILGERPSRLLTLDDEQTLASARADPQAFVEQHPHETMVIDEVQREPQLILAIKATIDRDRRPGRFVLTGSSDLMRLERTPDSLAGRATTLHLQGLSRGERLGRVDDIVALLRDIASRPVEFTTKWRRSDYVAALACGGYPEVHGLEGRLRNTWLDSYLSRIIQRGARDVYRATQPARLQSVMRLIAAQQSGELVKARIAEHASLAASTVTTYLDVLETLFLVSLLPPWTPNLTRREIGRPKAIVSDSALAMRLDRVTEEQLLPLIGSDHLGGLLEGFVVAELLKQSGWSDEDYRLYHYRDRNGLEVDVVIELGDGTVVGLEVKAAKTFKSEHFAGLASLADKLGDRFRGGYVLNTSNTGYQYATRLWGLPISALWEW